MLQYSKNISIKECNTRLITVLMYFVVFVTCSFSTSAQNCLYGIIKDEETLYPLEKVSVELHSTTDSSQLSGTVTNSNGVFAFNQIYHGTYYLLIRSVTYQPKIVAELNLSNNNIDIGIITLKASVNSLRAVIVSARQGLISANIDKQVFKASQFLTAKGGSAVDVLKNLPSVTVNTFGEISLRGSSGIQILLNGKQVQGDINVILSQLSANNIENIELITAPSAKYDANGKAGIINIITKKETGNGWFVTLNGQKGLPSFHSYDNHVFPKRYGADATIAFNHNKWNISIDLNYQRNDASGYREGDVNTTIVSVFTSFPSNGERSFKRYNYSARTSITYTPKNDVFNVGLYAGKKFQARTADLLYDVFKTDLIDNTVIAKYEYFNANLQTKEANIYIANIDYSHSFQNKTSLTASFLYEYDDLYGNTKNLNQGWPKATDTLQYTYNPNTNPLHGLRVVLSYNYKIGKLNIESGYQFRYNKQEGNFLYLTKVLHTSDYVVDPAFSSNVTTHSNIHSLYTQLNGTTKRLQYAAGLRYEYSQRVLSFSNDTLAGNTLVLNNIFPSASLIYIMQNKWKLKADYSRRIQRTNNFELNPFPEREHSETLEQGDPNLLPELTGIVQTGIIKDFKDGSFFSTLYYQHTKNPIQRVNSVYTDSILNRIYTNAGNADRWGMEAGVSATPAKWLQVYFVGNVYDLTITGSLFNDSVQVNNHGWAYSLNTNLSFVIDPTFSVQLSANYTSEQPTAQGENSYFFSPNAAIKKTFMNGRLTATLQWQNIDMDLNISNRQRITTYGENFYTTTNYIVEPDVLLLNLGFNLKQNNKKIKLPASEFGEKEF